MTPPIESPAVKPEPSYAPVYAAALYPELSKIARKHGYALAVHGSLQRDFDLIAVPWIDCPSEPDALIDEFLSTFDIRKVGGPPSDKPHGRRAWTLAIGHGTCAIDLSFMPFPAPAASDSRGMDGYVLVPREVLDLYNFMRAAFVPFTSQHEQINISLQEAIAAMSAAPAPPAVANMVDMSVVEQALTDPENQPSQWGTVPAVVSGEDTARLNWIEQQFRTCTVHMNGENPYAPSGSRIRNLRGRTFRDAIDREIDEDAK